MADMGQSVRARAVRAACMYTTSNLALIAAAWATGSPALRALAVCNTVLVALVVAAVGALRPGAMQQAFASLGVARGAPEALLDFATHTWPVALVSPWFAAAAAHPWGAAVALLPPLALSVYSRTVDVAWVYGTDLLSGVGLATALVPLVTYGVVVATGALLSASASALEKRNQMPPL